jgi:hypothetical protein
MVVADRLVGFQGEDLGSSLTIVLIISMAG